MIAASISLLLASSSSTLPQIELFSPASTSLSGTVIGVDTDGDTAYVCTRKQLRKMVLDGNRIRTVDSIPVPTSRSWDRTRYVALGDGFGILSAAYSTPGSADNDSTILAVDWKDRHWKAFPALGPVHASNRTIQGVRLSASTAAIARTEGLFLASVFTRKSTGERDSLVLKRPKNVPVDPYWEAISMDSTGIVAKSSSDALEVWNIPGSSIDPVSGFESIERQGILLPPPPKDPVAIPVPNTPAPLRLDAANVLSIGRADSVMYLWNSSSPTGWSISGGFPMPGNRGPASHAYGAPFETTRSGFGFHLVSGEGVQVLLGREPGSLPMPVATLPGGYFPGTAFGNTALWQAGSSDLKAYPITRQGASAVAPSRKIDGWSATAAPGILRLAGTPGAEVDVFDAVGQRLGRFAIGASGMSDFVTSGGRPVLVRCGGIARSLFVPR